MTYRGYDRSVEDLSGLDLSVVHPDQVQAKPAEVVILNENDLVNDDGMRYGIHVTVRGTRDTQVALRHLVEKYGEDRVYGSSSITDQFRWSLQHPDQVAQPIQGEVHCANKNWKYRVVEHECYPTGLWSLQAWSDEIGKWYHTKWVNAKERLECLQEVNCGKERISLRG